MHENYKLKKLIEILVENIIKEADENEETNIGLDLGGSSPQETPDSGDVPATNTDDSSIGSNDPEGIDTTGDTDLTDTATDSNLGSSSSGFKGSSYGGSSSSSPSTETSDINNDGSQIVQSQTVNSETNMLEDPTQATIEMAIDLSTKTGNSQEIVNAVKSNIQKYFGNIEDATGIVQGLWDTNDTKLRSVAVKLLMFIQGD